MVAKLSGLVAIGLAIAELLGLMVAKLLGLVAVRLAVAKLLGLIAVGLAVTKLLGLVAIGLAGKFLASWRFPAASRLTQRLGGRYGLGRLFRCFALAGFPLFAAAEVLFVKSFLSFPQRGPLCLDLKPIRRITVGFRVLICQTADNGGGKANIGHAQKRTVAPTHGLTKLRLCKGNLDLQALTHLRKVGGSPRGVFRRVTGQQQQPHVPRSGSRLHRFLANVQHSGSFAQAQRGQDFLTHWLPPN